MSFLRPHRTGYRGAISFALALTVGCVLIAACDGPSEPIQQALAGICEGRGVAETAPYEGGPGPHPIVLLNTSGERHKWSHGMPEGWQPASVGDTELVACIGDEQSTLINTIPCSLPGIDLPLPPVKSYEYGVEVQVLAAQTGALVARQTLYSFPLTGCRQSNCHLPSGRACGSSHVTPAQLDNWLIGIVEKGEPLRTLRGHESTVNSVAWSPDGQALASASSDGRVIVWDVRTGQPIHTLEAHAGTLERSLAARISPLSGVAWSPDGSSLATGSLDLTAVLWDAESGRAIRTLAQHDLPVLSVAWSPDGSTLATGSADNSIILWDVQTGKALSTLTGHIDVVYSVAWSPDGSLLASASADGTVLIWDVERGRPLQALIGHSEAVLSVAWSPDGQTMASGSWDGSVMLWDVQSGQPLFSQREHNSTVSSVVFSPDGRRLASGSLDSVVILWDTQSGTQVHMLRENIVPVLSVAWSPVGEAKGDVLASAMRDGSVILWWTAPGG